MRMRCAQRTEKSIIDLLVYNWRNMGCKAYLHLAHSASNNAGNILNPITFELLLTTSRI